MKFIGKISLKVKFLLIIVGLSGTMLITYAYLALDDFEKDKLAYVFDSSKNFSNSTSNQFQSLLDLYIEKINFFIRGYDVTQNKIHPYSRSVFKNEKGIPVVLDVCGAGATKLRDDKCFELLNETKINIIKGNSSEVARIAGLDVTTKGVDASEVNKDLVQA